MKSRGEELWREFAKESTSSRASRRAFKASFVKQRRLTWTLTREISLQLVSHATILHSSITALTLILVSEALAGKL